MSVAIPLIMLFFVVGTGMIGSIIAAWDCDNIGDVFRGLYAMGVCYTCADFVYVLAS